ncbi:hypothetical protein PMAYCL1PPCAC_15512, partial [Pristionchus mayeri]
NPAHLLHFSICSLLSPFVRRRHHNTSLQEETRRNSHEKEGQLEQPRNSHLCNSSKAFCDESKDERVPQDNDKSTSASVRSSNSLYISPARHG